MADATPIPAGNAALSGVKATKSSPRIAFDPARRVLEIEGQSYPENAMAFYKPIIEWLRAELATGARVRLEARILYLNTSSSAALYRILELLDSSFLAGLENDVTWYYDRENEFPKEAADDFRDSVSLPFRVVELAPGEKAFGSFRERTDA